MVISHTYKYLFVELPHTASAAIHKELCEQYDGHSIIRKHAPYHQFLRGATEAEKEYFVFSCIRNPMDMAVSVYFWRKTNHHNLFTNPEKWREQGGFVTSKMREEYDYIQKTNAAFPQYLRHTYRLPYDNWSRLAHRSFDFLIRFERLRQDFSEALRRIGIEAARPLPERNKTDNRQQDFITYYTPETQAHARYVFGPYMAQWGYSFPASWEDVSVPWQGRAMFRLLGAGRWLYWRYVKEAPFYQKLFRLPERYEKP